ncbi:unnamed protein product [Strongylus vulgaris]|uniref:Uncharacterized protein n=1 Tax=Strongylus vulgaris TaxID=40348 RepID=A0A3P7J9Y8_STRVU|nr:unnamed protein product [Strongylus vulgaris]
MEGNVRQRQAKLDKLSEREELMKAVIEESNENMDLLKSSTLAIS